MSQLGVRSNHFDEQFVLATLRENLRRYQVMLTAAEAAAAQIGPLRELVQSAENAVRQIEAGQVQGDASEVRPGEFSRMTLLDAVISYLEPRGGEAKLREKVVPALTEGGALTSKERKPLGEVDEDARYRIVKGVVTRHSKGLLEYIEEPDDVVRLKR